MALGLVAAALPLLADEPYDLGFATLPALPLAFWLARWWAARRTMALVRRSGPSFAMVAAREPSGELARRSRLHLYPLDSRPGARPLCAVALIDGKGVPAGVAFPVEVRGVPTPGGRVVARSWEQWLWPAGRALLFADFPRPPFNQ